MKIKHLLTLYLFIVMTNIQASTLEYIKNNKMLDNQNYELPDSIRNSLSNSIKTKRFIFLGESDHYFEEKFKYRLKFIRSLIKMGYFNILDEMGFEDGIMVNKYLNSGNEDFLNKVGLYGFKYGTKLTSSKRTFVVSSKRYIRELYKLKQTYPKLNYGGYDLDVYPGTFYLYLDEVSQKLKSLTNYSKYFSNIELSKKSTKIADKVNLLNISYKIALTEFSKITSLIGNKTAKIFLNRFRNFIASVDFKQRMIDAAPDYSYSNQDLFPWREKQMFKNMLHIEDVAEIKEDNYILMGHNGHLTKSSEASFSINGDDKFWYSIGEWVSETYPQKVFAIWSLIGKGYHRGHGCPEGKTCSFKSTKPSLESYLLEIDDKNNFFFNINPKNFSENNGIYYTYVNAKDIFQGPLAKQADAIYFLPVVSDLED